ncbi:hypothetical protein PENTCL1PPCAC_14857 [Pristionchus entomophagus]|uniref:Uncharacterized protein n=1 Tax=Pristionchus entomophagus TaxID=358040 RepID=A0AAV5TAV8_9BILA|nr:hypothetical protein PENTCL1PPCAC_14857 [Pristionchus entomophagus]
MLPALFLLGFLLNPALANEETTASDTITESSTESNTKSKNWCTAERNGNFALCPDTAVENWNITNVFVTAVTNTVHADEKRQLTNDYLKKVFAANCKWPERQLLLPVINVSTWGAQTDSTKWPFGMFGNQSSFANDVSGAVHLIVATSERWRPLLLEFTKKWNITDDSLPSVNLSITATLIKYQKEMWIPTHLSNLAMDLSNTIRLMTSCPKPNELSEKEFLMRAYYNSQFASASPANCELTYRDEPEPDSSPRMSLLTSLVTFLVSAHLMFQ